MMVWSRKIHLKNTAVCGIYRLKFQGYQPIKPVEKLEQSGCIAQLSIVFPSCLSHCFELPHSFSIMNPMTDPITEVIVVTVRNAVFLHFSGCLSRFCLSFLLQEKEASPPQTRERLSKSPRSFQGLKFVSSNWSQVFWKHRHILTRLRFCDFQWSFYPICGSDCVKITMETWTITRFATSVFASFWMIRSKWRWSDKNAPKKPFGWQVRRMFHGQRSSHPE